MFVIREKKERKNTLFGTVLRNFLVPKDNFLGTYFVLGFQEPFFERFFLLKNMEKNFFQSLDGFSDLTWKKKI